MKKLNNKFLTRLGLFIVLWLIVIGTALYNQNKNAMRLIAEGDILRFEDPQQSLEKYRLAQERWLLLRYNKDFQKKMSAAESLAIKPLVIYLKDTATQSEIDELITDIKKLQGIRKVDFISKDRALEIYKDQYKAQPALLGLVTADILPAYLEVYLNDSSIRESVVTLSKSKKYVEEVVK